MNGAETLLIGGRSGVGKSVVGWEVSARLRAALGADVRLIRVLLTASDATAHARLVARELGSELEDGLNASDARARVLDREVASDTARVATDGRTVSDVASEIVALTRWAA